MKRLLSEETREKEAVQKTAADLRNMVKKVEAEKTELARLLQDSRQKVAGERMMQTQGARDGIERSRMVGHGV